MEPLLAALPITLIVFLMLVPRWPAWRAGLAGLVLALALGWSVFEIGEAVEAGRPRATAGSVAEAAFTATTILWIIFSALCLYQLQVRTGAVEVLREALSGLSQDVRLVTIVIAWFFGLFLEGAAGFGTSAALAAPLLVAFGYRPVEAVSIALIGHAAGVSFGAVGTPILPQEAVSGLSGAELARSTGIFHGLLGWFMLVAVVVLARRSEDETATRQVNVWPWAALAALLFLAPYTAIATWVGPELPTLGGALIGGALFAAALRFARREAATTDAAGTQGQEGQLLLALAPYLAVVVLILATRLLSPLQEALQAVEVQWTLFGGFRGTFQPLYHPGTMLFLGFLFGVLVRGASVQHAWLAAGAAARRIGPVAIALVAMLSLSRVMVHAGMVVSLADGAADVAGAAWPLLAPFVGALGTFVTGSATTSNILFSDFQLSTAETLDLPDATMLGAQGFGAAAGNIICPHNIIAGGATVALGGREGEVLRQTALPCLAYLVLGGLLALLFVS